MRRDLTGSTTAPNWGQTPIEETATALAQRTQRSRGAENGTPGNVGPPRAVCFLGTAAREALVASRAAVPTKNPGALRDGLSSHE